MGTSPFKVPELLQEIVAFVQNPRGLSSLSQVNRFVHGAVTPSLFRNIEVRLDFVDSLAEALRIEPQRAAQCTSLSFWGRHCEGAPVLDDSALEKLYSDIITILRVISTCGRLVSLKWRSRGYRGGEATLSEDVWNAISSVAGSLQELEMYIPSAEKDIWGSLTRTRFAHLRVLRLYIPDSHGWDCGHLQSMLDTLSLLEELSLQFPMCCPPGGFFLDQTHPHLKRFSFTCSALCDDSDFLERHPGLESLFLDTEQAFSTDTDTPPCQLLRVLNVDESALSLSPTLLDCPITHLRLREVEPYTDIPVFDTLRCLELDIGDARDDPIPPCVITFLRNAPVLDELGIIRNGPLSLPHGWSDSLTDALTVPSLNTPLRALRFRCSVALPQERLNDIGPLPPQLKYIGWDCHPADDAGRPQSLIYVIEQLGDGSFVVKTITRSVTEDWMAEGVLPFLGESWTP